MRAHVLLLTLLLAALAAFSCGKEAVNAPGAASNGADPELLAQALIERAGWPVADMNPGPAVEMPDLAGVLDGIESVEREVVTGDIVHYRMRIRFGPGSHDVFGLHRVVREPEPYRPIKTAKNMFGLHGTPGHFEVMYLFGSVTSAPDEQSIAAFLAGNDVDVWGIDQAYTLVTDAPSFDFMAEWGMQFDVDNLRTGISIARQVRRMTGSGNARMILMGYSTGLVTGFAALNYETQLPPGQRQIGAFIPVDNFFKTDRPEWTEAECGYLEVVRGWLDAGIYHNDYGALFRTLGYLATTDPAGESPIIPGVDNLHAALLAGAQTGLLFGFPGSVHFLAGVFEDGMPVDLSYTPVTQYLEWLQAFNSYGSNQFEYDFTGIHCGGVELPFDDHIGEIDIPVFFLGAGGGWGSLMDYTASLLTGCADVTLLTVSLQADPLLDIGHVDIFSAQNAEPEFWEPVLDWIESHSPKRGMGRSGIAVMD